MKKNISIIYFDENTPKEDIHKWRKGVKDVLGKDNAVIALPKNFDVLLECSIDQLLQVRAMIDTTLEIKFKDEQPIDDAYMMPNFQKTKYQN